MTTWIDWIIALGAMSGWGMLVLRLHLEGSSRQRQIEVLEATMRRLEADAQQSTRTRERLVDGGRTLGRRLRRQYEQTLVLRQMVDRLSERLAPIEGRAARTIRQRVAEAVHRESSNGTKLLSAYTTRRGIESRLVELDDFEAGEWWSRTGWQSGSMMPQQIRQAA